MPKVPASKFFPLFAHGDGTRRSYPPSLPGLTMNLAVQEASDRLLAAANIGGDPYPLYPSFDRNEIEWHIGTTVGPQVPLQAAATPVTNDTIDVTTASGYNSAVAIGARVVRIMNNMTLGAVTPANDTDVVVMPGVRVSGEVRWTGAWSRCRVRGPTPGVYSGGSIAKWASNAAPGTPQTDLIIDGIGISGDGGTDGYLIQPHFGMDRFAILNTRLHATKAFAYMTSVRHLFVGNVSGLCGVGGPATVTWGFRHDDDGPIVFVDCDLRSAQVAGESSYHLIRSKPPTGVPNVKHVYIKNCVGVENGFAKFFWANFTDLNIGTDRHASFICRSPRTYSADPIGGNGTIYPESVGIYAEVTDGLFYGRPSVGDLASSESGSLAATKNFASNQHFAYAGNPTWVNDPTGLPLS